MLRHVMVAVLLLGCGKSKEECRPDADAFVAWLTQQPYQGALFDIEGIPLARRADLPIHGLEVYANVRVTPTETTYQGETRTDEQLLDVLRAAQAGIDEEYQLGRLRGVPPNFPHQIAFLIDASTPWKRVVETLRIAASAQFTAPVLVFALDREVTPPARTRIDELLATASDKRKVLVESFGKVTARCPAATKALDALDKEKGHDKVAVLIQRVGAGLIECSCAVDLAQLRSVMWHLLVPPRPVAFLALDEIHVVDPSEAKLALPPDVTWDVANKQIAAGTRKLDLAIAR